VFELDLYRLAAAEQAIQARISRMMRRICKEPAMVNMPAPKGQLTANRPLADLTWMRVGGPADYFFFPDDKDDLSYFMKHLSSDIDVFPIGVGSNVIVRDGGVRAVVIRLGRAFNHIEISGNQIRVGAAVLDAHLAKQAAQAGLDLTFLRTIPGAIGGAVKMNAGCYGTYVADVLETVEVVLRSGVCKTLSAKNLNLRYRASDLPGGCVITAATLRAKAGDPNELAARMQEQLLRRDQSQPTKLRSAGSTFRNPAGFSSTGRPDDDHSLKAWKVIDE
jgi:UDP-N-acetylmuramate dehydrogenase